jgi:hypothetical protein|tara:strand:+ start:204 stop:461 length:258 start_codon:yes stop_codon:yes gene_type:complete
MNTNTETKRGRGRPSLKEGGGSFETIDLATMNELFKGNAGIVVSKVWLKKQKINLDNKANTAQATATEEPTVNMTHSPVEMTLTQ